MSCNCGGGNCGGRRRGAEKTASKKKTPSCGCGEEDCPFDGRLELFADDVIAGGWDDLDDIDQLPVEHSSSSGLVTEVDSRPQKEMQGCRTPPTYYVRETKSGRLYAPRSGVDYPQADPKQNRTQEKTKGSSIKERRHSRCDDASSIRRKPYYVGAQTESTALEGLKPVEFVLYHRLPATRNNDEPPITLQLTLAYRTSRGFGRHYPIVSVSEPCGEHGRTHCSFKVQSADRNAPTFSSVSALVDYHRCKGHVAMLKGEKSATVDLFPWWFDEDNHLLSSMHSDDYGYEEIGLSPPDAGTPLNYK